MSPTATRSRRAQPKTAGPARPSRPTGIIAQPSGPVVICTGGQLNERTFLLSDWEHEVRAGQHLLALGQHPAPVLGYRLDKTATTSHRSGLVGMPATWIGLEHLQHSEYPGTKGGGCR
jgi:hypothetical protein